MKQARQREIVRIINENSIETQEELMEKLADNGFTTTQATISRDIRELNLKKTIYSGNKRKYVVGNAAVDTANTGSYSQVLENCIISLEAAGNIIVVKTVPGMAMAVAAAVDKLDIEGIVGCIAGDDTLFAAIKHSGLSEDIIGEIKHVAKYAY